MSAARIAEVLAGHKVQARNGNYLVCCPAHDDDSPSLSLCDGDRGVKVHCFAGCSPGDVYAAIRRKDRKLLEPGQTAPEPVKWSSAYERRQHEKAAWMWNRRRPISGTIAETYLREGRRYNGPLPPTLAFLPPFKREHRPAMIAAFALPNEIEALTAARASNLKLIIERTAIATKEEAHAHHEVNKAKHRAKGDSTRVLAGGKRARHACGASLAALVSDSRGRDEGRTRS